MSDKPENMIPKIEKEKQEEQKKSQKDRNGIIGGLVFGAISFFFAYQAYKILFEFLIGKILVGIFALLTLIFIAVSMSSITTAVAADYRLQQWAQLVKECQNRPSDMTVEQWCDTKGISKSNYYYRL